MYNFNYHRAGSIDAAAAKLAESGDAKLLAGGMTLLPTMKQRLAQPSDLIDLNEIADLKGISVSGGTVTIGAMTRHADVAASAEVKQAIPALAKLANLIGDPAVRNRGTIGGSIANNDPSADYPAALVGLGATVVTNKREIAGEDFFTGMFETALDEGEIVTAVRFPVPQKAAYFKFPNPASRYAVVGVMVAKTADGVRVAVTGAGPCVFRQSAMESALSSNFSADALSGISQDADGLNEDIHASAEYRANLVVVGAKRAVAEIA
ncbi:xanthine dehydrogenase family protein subunit M [Emcibacter sp. SYSU 3D8]|uniref:FAD binding domain-containing protein n=1 Tax=Emcibacter sp. SYSU 3D8 TaxID=3133969 RepID=UPI0031FEC5E8